MALRGSKVIRKERGGTFCGAVNGDGNKGGVVHFAWITNIIGWQLGEKENK